MNNHTRFDPGIISLDIRPNAMLIAIKGGEVYEFKNKTTKSTKLL